MTPSLDLLLAATRGAVRDAARNAVTDCTEISVLDELLSRPVTRRAIEPAQTPVVPACLDAAVRAVAPLPERTLAEALATASPSLRWIAPYRPDDGTDALTAGYAVAMLVGTDPPIRGDYQTPFVSPDVIVTFTLQGPGLYYPLHRHKAPEIYHVISGTAQWRRDGEPWRRRLPGEWLFHASEQGHAMRTGDAPLLAMASWIDHLDAPPPVLEVDEPRQGARRMDGYGESL